MVRSAGAWILRCLGGGGAGLGGKVTEIGGVFVVEIV